MHGYLSLRNFEVALQHSRKVNKKFLPKRFLSVPIRVIRGFSCFFRLKAFGQRSEQA